MALFELEQTYGEEAEEWTRPTFKDCAAKDIDLIFFNEDEHADLHMIDDKGKFPVIVEEEDLRIHSAHWEAGAKQNFDTGLYTAHTILYIKVADYGLKPKVGKLLVLDADALKRTYTIKHCEEEAGVYRMTLERTRQ